MKNFKITAQEDGKEYWISRSIAVVGIVLVKKSSQEIYVLANKRGPGTPDYQGYWNFPCGYLDFDETIEEAARREIFEETGYQVSYLRVDSINSDPSENKQNVSVRMTVCLADFPEQSVPKGGEKNEVEEVKWINVKDIKNYSWAFNHDSLLRNILWNYFNIIC